MRPSEVKVGDRFGRLFVLEIRQQNGKNNIAKAHEALARNPESRIIGISKVNDWFGSHPEIRQQNLLSKESKLQRQYREFLEREGYIVEREFFLEGHYFDLKINNFLIEINGYIYHASEYENLLNPSAQGPSTVYRSESYHKSLLDLATRNGYHLVQLWEHNSFYFNSFLLLSQLSGIAKIEDYTQIIDGCRVICNDYGFNIQGPYLPDSGRWISTGHNEVVDSDYEKAKVLCFNSGYTVLD